MRSNYIYVILLMLGMIFSCQRPELSDPDALLHPENGNAETLALTFSALLPSSPSTKAMGDEPFKGEGGDIESMHLVVFDENGMLVETREATIVGQKAHESHLYETEFKVTLTVTDSPRSIHFIANCPVDQIAYGHEASIIGNLYVQKDNDSTTPETAYWARIEVPYIKYQEVEVDGKKVNVLDDAIQANFKCVPMLRNFAQVVVTDATGNNDLFEFIGFSVYNTIDIGTVAPYNNTTQKFQSFLDPDGSKYSYPELTALNYKGHALAAAELNTELPKDANDNVIFYKEYDTTDPDDPETIFYMYERRISVKTDQEEDWDESPPHVIVKGEYDNKVYYYKVDLVYDVIDDNGTPDDKTDDTVTDIEYYNILRNFRYQFTITAVAGKGYDTLEEAIQGSTSNNLSGSSTTSKLTNISDAQGRLWVSYTDTTLVNSNKVALRYKYIPDLGNIVNNELVINNDLAADGGHITLDGFVGGVIAEYQVASADISTGPWAGYREIILTINEPENTTVEQTVTIRTQNVNLKRDIRYYLKQQYSLEIECTPKVAATINAPVELDIKLPLGLTDDMFPLDLAIEVYDMTLSPDASMNTLPVEVSASVIPLPEKEGKPTFHYIKTIEKKSDYDALQTVGNRKVFTTYWLTNTVDNESTIYVVNKYFNVASDNFINTKSFNGRFTKETLGTNEAQTVDYKFDIKAPVPDGMTVTVTLSRLAPIASGSGLTPTGTPGVYTYTPTSTGGEQTIHLQTVSNEEGICAVSLTTADEYNYADENDTIDQLGLVNITGKTVILEFVLDHSNTNQYSVVTSVTADDNTTNIQFNSSYTRTNQDPSDYVVTISNLNIADAMPTTDITFQCVLTWWYNTYTYSITLTAKELYDKLKNSQSTTFDLGTK